MAIVLNLTFINQKLLRNFPLPPTVHTKTQILIAGEGQGEGKPHFHLNHF